MPKLVDMSGERYGRLTVIERGEPVVGKDGRTRTRWVCKCDCGNTTLVLRENLLSGITKSCGCLRRETSSIVNMSHGLRRTRLYSIWTNMCTRCNNPNNPRYSDYGGRGICVCPEWDDDFMAFNNWAYANGYSDDLTLDRMDNDGDYEPSNCRWVSYKEQNNNTRKNHCLTYMGKTQTVSQWSKEIGIPYITLLARINSYGWTVERALSEPVHNSK